MEDRAQLKELRDRIDRLLVLDGVAPPSDLGRAGVDARTIFELQREVDVLKERLRGHEEGCGERYREIFAGLDRHQAASDTGRAKLHERIDKLEQRVLKVMIATAFAAGALGSVIGPIAQTIFAGAGG